MQFKRIDELRVGMRLARPIYNKNGVLLFEREAKITEQGIANIKNFGLIGLFILEPAEPAPPMTEEDREFERFQTVNVFSLMDEIAKIKSTGRTAKLSIIVANIIRSYGHLEKKINFTQNLRSEEDHEYKHALNVAILAAMMSNQLNCKVEDRLDVVTSALLWPIKDYELIDKINSANPNVRRFRMQADMLVRAATGGQMEENMKIMECGRILAVAEMFDNMTAMQMDNTPESEVATVKFLLDKEYFFNKETVVSLTKSINILVPGICVELNTGSKALILGENERDMFKPTVLCFDNNEIMDLSTGAYSDITIVDIMKTMDNRHVFGEAGNIPAEGTAEEQ